MSLLVRLDRTEPPGPVVATIHAAVLALDGGLPVVQVMPLGDHVGLSLLPQKVAAGLASGLGLIGALLVAVGIYGLMAYLVQQRVREVGIRLALGARLEQVTRLLMRRGAVLTALGVAGGAGLALPASRVLSSLLFGTAGTLPWIVLVTSLALAALTLAASLLPARRVARLAPGQALRQH